MTKIDIVFSGEAPDLTFVEVEHQGKSIDAGDWVREPERQINVLQIDLPRLASRLGGHKAMFEGNPDFKTASMIRINLLQAVAAPMVYRSWDFGYKLKNLGQHLGEIPNLGRVNILNLDREHLDALDFGLWTDEQDDPVCGLRLIPLWLYPYLRPGQVLTSISGDHVTVGEYYTDPDKPGYVDNDNRGGYLAYGVIPK